MSPDAPVPVTPAEITRAPDDAPVDAALVAELAAARAARERQVRASHAPATQRLYAVDWAEFRAWCARLAPVDPTLVPLPASDATLSTWVGSLAALAHVTIRRKLAAVRLAHERLGYPLLDAEMPATTAALRGHGRDRRDDPVRRQRAATDELICRLADACDAATPMGARNRALLLVGFDGAFRRSELVGIDHEHLTRGTAGVAVHLPHSKSDQEGVGATVTLLARPESPWCPVAALAHWCALSGRTAGPVFVALRGSRHCRAPGAARLSAQAVARVVKAAAAAANVPGDFAGHSLRRGLVTSAIAANVPLEQVMRHARHRSIQTTLGYAEHRTSAAVHPGVGLGSETVGTPPTNKTSVEDRPGQPDELPALLVT